MYNVILSRQFKKDLHLAQKQGLNLALLTQVVTTLARGEPLSPKLRDHELSGKLKGFRECHILGDWLLIYRISKAPPELFLSRTGSHSYLFGK